MARWLGEPPLSLTPDELAAAIAAGQAAVLRQLADEVERHPTLTPTQLRDVITAAADEFDRLAAGGGGRPKSSGPHPPG